MDPKLSPPMEGRPRHTAFWRRQEDLLAETLGTALDDPEIQPCWNEIASKLYAVLRSGEHSGTAPHIAQIETETHAMVARLISLLRERVPALEHALESDLGRWIHTLTIKGLAPEIDVHIPEKWAHFLPDNPVVVTAEGEFIFPLKASDDPRYTRWTREVRDYFRSLRPEGTRGAPRKRQMDEPSKAGRRSLDPELAERAFNMNQRGAHWKEIAHACYPKHKPAELRTDKIRKHIGRLVERGGIDARRRQKLGRNN